MGFLRYPSDLASDYITITASKYVSQSDGGAGRIGNYVSGPSDGPSILLPLPDLPALSSQQKYGALSGALNTVLAGGLAEAYNAISDSLATGQNETDIEGIAQRLSDRFSAAGNPVAREVAAGIAGSVVGINSAQFQTLADGQISNPNIELLYAGPTLRTFSMNWTLAPKNQIEANSVFEIIRQMKQWHLPKRADPGMLRVPNVFDLKINVQGAESKQYQKYKTCVLEAFSVKQDAAGSHMTLPGGEPLVSTMTCVWKEINITTAEDFGSGI